MDTRIFETRGLMGHNAANEIGNKLKGLLMLQIEVNIIFAAAPSQNEVLQSLTERKDIDWTKVNAFHMDEYIDLSADAPQGFGNFLKVGLFNKLPFKSVNYLNGNAEDKELECDRYSSLLKQYPADIVCMGIGENGHIAFNDPPVADFQDKKLVKVVLLDEACRQQQVNDGCFKLIGDVPIHALTLTIPALIKPPFIYCIVPGPTKSQAVFNTINQPIAERYPSTILRNHPNAILFLDKESASILRKA